MTNPTLHACEIFDTFMELYKYVVHNMSVELPFNFVGSVQGWLVCALLPVEGSARLNLVNGVSKNNA